jgi:hypothetical protein
MFQIAESCPAIFLFHRDAEETEGAQFGPEVAWEGVGLVDLVRQRRDLVVAETAHRVAQQFGRLAEVEIERRIGIAYHGPVRPIEAVQQRGRPATGTPDQSRAGWPAIRTPDEIRGKDGAVEKTRTSTGCPTSTSS